LAQGNTLRVDWRLDHTQAAVPAAAVPAAAEPVAATGPAAQSLQAIERSHIIAMLKKARGVIEGPQGAARPLNMDARTTRLRMKKLGITRADYALDAEP